MLLQLGDYGTDEHGWVGAGEGEETEGGPLVQEVAVAVDAVGFGEVTGDESLDQGKVEGFEGGVVGVDVDAGGEGKVRGAGCECAGGWRGGIGLRDVVRRTMRVRDCGDGWIAWL